MGVMYILWLRQMKRYMRSHSRLLGAIGQPILFLLALGYGIGSIYKRAGAGDYIDFLTPGIITQTILFSAVFWGINIIWDKQFGFLKEALVAPVSRLRLLMGSALGGATISLFQGIIVFAIATMLGFRPYNWWVLPGTLAIMVMLSVSLTAFGAGIASMVNDFQGFQAINNFLIFPLYFLSSALYPLNNVPEALRIIASINPLSYAVDALRTTLIHQSHFGLTKDLIVLAVTLIVLMIFGVNRFSKIEA